MAMTQTALLWLASFATLATIGMFLQYGDQATRPLVGFTASITWALVSISAFNVTVARDATVYEFSFTPIVYFAGGLALITFLFVLRLLLVTAKDEAANADFDAFKG